MEIPLTKRGILTDLPSEFAFFTVTVWPTGAARGRPTARNSSIALAILAILAILPVGFAVLMGEGEELVHLTTGDGSTVETATCVALATGAVFPRI